MTIRTLIIALSLAGSVACSTSSTNGNEAELPTGDAVAKSVGERTRAAEENGKTGIIVASSEDGASTEEAPQPAEPKEPEAAAPETTFRINEAGVLVQADGTALEEVPAPATDEEQAVVIHSNAMEHGKVVEALDKLRTAGWSRIALQVEAAEGEPAEQEKAPE